MPFYGRELTSWNSAKNQVFQSALYELTNSFLILTIYFFLIQVRVRCTEEILVSIYLPFISVLNTFPSITRPCFLLVQLPPKLDIISYFKQSTTRICCLNWVHYHYAQIHSNFCNFSCTYLPFLSWILGKMMCCWDISVTFSISEYILYQLSTKFGA